MLNWIKFFQSGSLPLWRPPPAALWVDPNLLPRRGGMASTGPGQHSRGSLQGRQRKDRGDDMLLSSTLAGKTEDALLINWIYSSVWHHFSSNGYAAKNEINKSMLQQNVQMYLFANLITGDKATLFLSGQGFVSATQWTKNAMHFKSLGRDLFDLTKNAPKMWTAVSFKTLQFRNSTLWNFKRIRNLTWRDILIWLGYNVSGFWIFCKYF